MLRAEVPEEHLLETSNAGAKSPKRSHVSVCDVKAQAQKMFESV